MQIGYTAPHDQTFGRLGRVPDNTRIPKIALGFEMLGDVKESVYRPGIVYFRFLETEPLNYSRRSRVL